MKSNNGAGMCPEKFPGKWEKPPKMVSGPISGPSGTASELFTETLWELFQMACGKQQETARGATEGKHAEAGGNGKRHRAGQRFRFRQGPDLARRDGENFCSRRRRKQKKAESGALELNFVVVVHKPDGENCTQLTNYFIFLKFFLTLKTIKFII